MGIFIYIVFRNRFLYGFMFIYIYIYILWNLSIKASRHLSNEDTVCSPNHIEVTRSATTTETRPGRPTDCLSAAIA